MKKLLFLLSLLPAVCLADPLGGLTRSSDVLLTTQAVSGGGGTTIWVKEDGSAVDNAVSSMNFTGGLNVTSSPSGQANVTVDFSSITSLSSTQFIQNSLTPTSATQAFNVKEGTVTFQLVVSSITGLSSGSQRDLMIRAGPGSGANTIDFIDDNGTTKMSIGRNNEITMNSNFRFATGDIYNIGRAGDSRAGGIYSSTNIWVGWSSPLEPGTNRRLLVTNDGGQGTDLLAVLRGKSSGQTGTKLQLQDVSSANLSRPEADFDSSFTDSTDATRKGRATFRVWDTSAREYERADTDGTNPFTTFFGSTTFTSTVAFRSAIDAGGFGTSGQVLQSNGNNAAPSWTTVGSGALDPATTNYIHNQNSLQSGATFYVSSGSVAGPFYSLGYVQYQQTNNAAGSPSVVISTFIPGGGTGGRHYVTHLLGADALSRPNFILSASTEPIDTSSGLAPSGPRINLIPKGTVGAGSISSSIDGQSVFNWTPTAASYFVPLDAVSPLFITYNGGRAGELRLSQISDSSKYIALRSSDTLGLAWTTVLPSTWASVGSVLKISLIVGNTVYTEWGTDNTGGGSGFSLAITTGTNGAFTGMAISSSSTNALIVFDSATTTGLKVGATYAFALNASSVTLAGPLIAGGGVTLTPGAGGTTISSNGSGTSNTKFSTGTYQSQPAVVMSTGPALVVMSSDNFIAQLPTISGQINSTTIYFRLNPSSVTLNGQLFAGSNITLTPTTGGTTIAASGGGGGTGVSSFTYTFNAAQANLPGANAPYISNSTNAASAGVFFDETSTQTCTWATTLTNYQGNQLKADMIFTSSATSGTVNWGVYVECKTPNVDALDYDTDSFDVINSTSVTLGSTSGMAMKATATLTNNDSCVNGDMLRIKLERSAQSLDTAVGKARLRFLRIYE